MWLWDQKAKRGLTWMNTIWQHCQNGQILALLDLRAFIFFSARVLGILKRYAYLRDCTLPVMKFTLFINEDTEYSKNDSIWFVAPDRGRKNCG